MKILLVQHKAILGGQGGVEKVCCFIANNFVSIGHDVEIVTMEDVEGEVVYPLDARVRVTNLFDPKIQQLPLMLVIRYEGRNITKWIYKKFLKEKAKIHNRGIYKKNGGRRAVFEYNLRNRSKAWYDYITKYSPDIIIAMSPESLLEITFEREYQTPIIVSINGRPDYDYTDVLWKKPKHLLENSQNSYKRLSGCQILFDSYKDFLPETFSGKVYVISNPVPQVNTEDIVVHTNEKDRFVVINVASIIINHKQQNIAIDVFSRLAKKYSKWDLYFWGTGEDESILREKIVKLGLKDRIFLKGFTDSPMEELKKSDIFLFPSKFEGFGMALAEAMSVGLPSIGFDTCPGVNELICHNKNGFLAKDNTEMQEYLEKLMNDHELRNKFGKQANEDMKKYSPELIKYKWEELVKTFEK